MPHSSSQRRRDYQRKRYANDPAYRAAKQNRARERANSPEWKTAFRRARLQRKYGITPEQYDVMFQTQGQACGICKAKDCDRWCVDHCHSTGKVRGILCNNCNLMIGQAGDNEQILIDAVFYLLEHRK